MHSLKPALLLCFFLLLSHETAFGQDGDALIREALAAVRGNNLDEALAKANAAVKTDPANPRFLFARARVYDFRREHRKAVADLDTVIATQPRAAEALQQRGEQHFKLGQMKEAISDFDRVIELVPSQEAHHWQRGIAYYYAGRFKEGKRQFEIHQTVNPEDVENAVWHYLCAARLDGIEKARAALIPISADGRVPMMEVHALFAGKATADDVLAAARKGKPSAKEAELRLFYAHLYLGLYFEASGKEKEAQEHISEASKTADAAGYMGDVARVHAALLKGKKPK